MSISTIILIILVLICILNIILFWRFLYRGIKIHQLEIELQNKSQSLEINLQTKSELEGDKRVLQEQMKNLEILYQESKQKLQNAGQIEKDNTTLQSEIAVKTEKIEQLQKALEEQKMALEEIKKQMKLEFQKISHDLLEEQRNKFKEQSEDSINSITKPLRENITEFKNKLEETDKNQIQRTALLEKTIEDNSKATQELANAFSKEKKLQGSWGEHQLELRLEGSGLIKGPDYTTQVAVKGTETETGKLYIDAIVYLPEKKHLIIDAKVSLVNYYNMQNAHTEEEKEQYKKEFIKNVKVQINDLGSKNYQDALKKDMDLRSPEFVFMFMPLEESFMFALREEPTLYNEALQKKVVLCSPTSLYGVLMTVKSMWSAVKQNENTLEIKKASIDLIKRMEGFMGEIEKLENQFGTVQKTFGTIKTKLDGQQGVLRLTKRLNDLGINNSLKIKNMEEPELLEEHREDIKLLDSAGELFQQEENNANNI